MRDVDKELKDAFLSMTVPEGLNQDTLRLIEQRRSLGNEAVRSQEGVGACFPADEGGTEDSSFSDASSRIRSERSSASASVPRARVVSRRRNQVARVAAIAACLAVAAIGMLGYGMVKTPVAYMDIDVNPSIGLEINRFNDVVGAHAYNEDGETVLDEVDLVGMSCERALEVLTGSDSLDQYVNADSYMEISVSGDNADQVNALLAWGESSIEKALYEGSCRRVDAEDRQEAHAHHMGMGKYQAAKALSEVDPTVEIEECMGMSMRELRDRLDEAGVATHGECLAEGCSDSACAGSNADREQIRNRRGDDEGHHGQGR